MKQYVVDAFTDEPFAGNPAAVCVMDRWPSDESMMKLAIDTRGNYRHHRGVSLEGLIRANR